jgi:hypothetical protein
MDNKYFTDSEWMARYIKDPNFCPYCENRGVESERLEAESDFATAIVKCLSCKKAWFDVYSLTAIEVADEDLWEGEVDYSADDIYAGGNQ